MSDLGSIDEDAPRRVGRARSAGSASKAREVAARRPSLEVLALGATPPLGRRARRGALRTPGRTTLYQLPLGLRPAPSGWDRGDRRDDERAVYDALVRPRARPQLFALIARRRTTSTEDDGSSRSAASTLPRPRRPEVRPMGAEQSNSSIVFGDELVLKVFRRLEPGLNPELEMLRFLTSAASRTSPALRGWYALRGRRSLDATLGVAAGVRRRRRATAGSSRSTTLGGDPATRSSTGSPSSARSSGEMHSVLGSDAERPGLRARGAERRRRSSLLTATIDEEIERVFLDLPERRRGARADRRPRRGGARPAARCSHVGVGGQRDPPPRRLPPRPDPAARRRRLGHPRLRGRARALAASSGAASARRCATSPGCCARSPTPPRPRSCCAARPRREDWERARARGVPRAATSSPSTPALLPPGEAGDRRSCWRSSSSRRRSTSCATSSTTGPTGCRSPSPASPGCSRTTLT